jgi:hypothetical protein
MADVLEIVSDALLELGVLAAGETPSAADASGGMKALNRLVDMWAAERLMIYTNTRSTFTVVSGTASYSVGVGGDCDIPFPVFVEHVNFQDTSLSPSLEYQMQPLTNDAYSRIPIKDLTSPRPTSYYWNATFPLGTMILWPVPTLSTLQGVLYAPEQVSEFASLNDTISLPPGYRRMLVKNLAMEMAPSYNRPPSQELKEQAMESKAVVKRANVSLMDMQMDAGALIQGRNARYIYSIMTGS